jgi:hypothetical protein
MRRVPGERIGPGAGWLLQHQAFPQSVVVRVRHRVIAPRAVLRGQLATLIVSKRRGAGVVNPQGNWRSNVFVSPIFLPCAAGNSWPESVSRPAPNVKYLDPTPLPPLQVTSLDIE